MPNEFWLNVASGLAGSYGLSSEAMLVLIAFLFSASVSFGLGMMTRNRLVGVGSFFFMFIFFALIDAISWYIVVLPLIVSSVIILITHRGN